MRFMMLMIPKGYEKAAPGTMPDAKAVAAMMKYNEALQKAGVIGVEMECVPEKIAEEITKRVKILVFSMGSGPNCDGQFLFACDLLGTNPGHYPRHSITYCRLLEQATEAMIQYKKDVLSGAYPTEKHVIKIRDGEYDRFMEEIGKRGY